MKRIILALAFILPTQAAELRLKSSVYRGQLPVLVEDLFEVKHGSKELRQRPVLWQNAQGWNQAADLVKGDDMTFVGADKVWLGLCQPLDMDVISQVVKAKLQSQLVPYADKIRLKSLRPMAGEASCLALNVTVTNSQLSRPLKSRFSSLHQLSDGSELQLWWLNQLQVFAPVTRQKIQPLQNLSAQQLDYQWVSPGFRDVHQWLDFRVNQHRSKKSIGAGQLIDASNSEKTPLIDKGDSITVVYQHQGIRIETDGIALKAGFAGEVISVKADNATGVIKAVIIAKTKQQRGVVHALL
ncbi:MAG: flagella basal body P-ring formation protein FlgA [Phenylobacterium sp.]|jgi:flagella basal body P-ring formation protein FlgA